MRTVDTRSEIDISNLYLGHKRVIGSTMGTQADLETLVELTAAWELHPEIDEMHPLNETATAFAAMQDLEAVGKIVVTN